MDTELYLLGSSEEMTLSTMMIVEGSENKRPGVLCEVEGPFIVLEKDNNNSRWYTKSLVDNGILNVPYTKKMLKNRTLYGEASHPDDRFDVKLPLISHNITDLWYNDDNSILMGRADVLDTPSGRIIYTLVQYGSKIGISVRARGRLINKNGKKVPDESVYQFKTFDFVPNPGFDEARMSPVNESENDVDLAESFMDYVKEASVSELKCVQSIFESVSDEVLGDVKKAIADRINDDTVSCGTFSFESVADTLYEETVKKDEEALMLEEKIEQLEGELNDARGQITSLTEEVSTLKQEVTTKTEDIDSMSQRLVALSESEDSLTEQNEALQKRCSKMVGTIKRYREHSESLMQNLEESEQVVDLLEMENEDFLQRLNDVSSRVAITEVAGAVEKPYVPKKKVLPQGKSRVLNESVVDTPMVASSPKEVRNNKQRMNFIKNCGN